MYPPIDCLWCSVSTGLTLELVVLLAVIDEVEEVTLTLTDTVEDEEMVLTMDEVDEEPVEVDPCPVVHSEDGGGFWNA